MRVLFEELGAGEFAAEEYAAAVDSPVILAPGLVGKQGACLGMVYSCCWLLKALTRAEIS